MCPISGVSYAELRYEVPTLKPEHKEPNYSTPPSGVHSIHDTDHKQSHSHPAHLQGGNSLPCMCIV